MARETFHYHKVDGETMETMAHVRALIGQLAETLEEALPDSRSKSLALTHLEDCSMRSMQALALEYGELVPFGG